MIKTTVLGAGAWGLALADYLGRRGKAVTVWDRSPDVLDRLRSSRTIDRPSGLVVADGVNYVDDIATATADANVILSVVPSFATADMCRALAKQPKYAPDALFVNCSKGIEPETLRLPWQIFAEELAGFSSLRYAVLAGPSHAEEVSRCVPTAVVASAPLLSVAEMLQKHFAGPAFRVYVQPDYKAVEVGGAMKNVIAIAAGICDGEGFGDNTKAALITRGVAEIARLAVAMGGNAETVAGLSGLGDLIVTAMSHHSRNRQFGELLATGMGPENALGEVGAVVEGYRTAKSAQALTMRYGLDMPLVQTIYDVLYGDVSIDDGIAILLDRDPNRESLQ